VIVFAGIYLAAHYFPGYRHEANPISDLGQRVAPYNPTSTSLIIFNSAMFVAGSLVIIASLRLHSHLATSTFVLLFIHGIAIMGVGIFPSPIKVLHAAFALATFLSGEAVAFSAFTHSSSAIRYAFLTISIVSFVSLIGFAYWKTVAGTGAAERWIVYPTTLCLIIYGIYLANAAAKNV
jgi:hypothetical membrane protein